MTWLLPTDDITVCHTRAIHFVCFYDGIRLASGWRKWTYNGLKRGQSATYSQRQLQRRVIIIHGSVIISDPFHSMSCDQPIPTIVCPVLLFYTSSDSERYIDHKTGHSHLDGWVSVDAAFILNVRHHRHCEILLSWSLTGRLVCLDCALGEEQLPLRVMPTGK